MTKIVSARAVIDEALSWQGTPYHHLGRKKGHAIDCIGLILEVLKNCGTSLGGYIDEPYGRVPNSKLKRGVAKHCIELWDKDKNPNLPPLNWAKEGDVILIAWNKEPMHIAFVTRRPIIDWYMIHAYGEVGKVTYHRIDETWLPRIAGLYRVPGVE